MLTDLVVWSVFSYFLIWSIGGEGYYFEPVRNKYQVSTISMHIIMYLLMLILWFSFVLWFDLFCFVSISLSYSLDLVYLKLIVLVRRMIFVLLFGTLNL